MSDQSDRTRRVLRSVDVSVRFSRAGDAAAGRGTPSFALVCLFGMLCALVCASCGRTDIEQPSNGVGESNWQARDYFAGCEVDADCAAGLQCLCGFCMLPCDGSVGDCDLLSTRDTECIEAAEVFDGCDMSASLPVCTLLCSEDSECRVGGMPGTCFNGLCVNDDRAGEDAGDTGLDAGIDADAGTETTILPASCDPSLPRGLQPACVPQPGQALECGTGFGMCERGITVVDDDGFESPCVLRPDPADDGAACASNADCTIDELCLNEQLEAGEDVTDACTPDESGACRRSSCVDMRTAETCDATADCPADAACVFGYCHALTTAPLDEEICNGIDDDCNGRIDDWTDGVCGVCPFNSVRVQATDQVGSTGFVCVDMYEASRIDATADSAGSASLYSVSMPGVLPWTGVDGFEAASACRGTAYREQFPAGQQQQALHPKQLCVTFQWENGCSGTVGSQQETVWPFGDDWDPDACNVDGDGIEPTGSSAACSSGHGLSEVYDMAGNVAEWTRFGLEDPVRIYGGSWQLTDPAGAECTSYIEEDDIVDLSTIGFRCCSIPAQP